MNVHRLTVTATYAFPGLVGSLQQLAGVKVLLGDMATQSLTCTFQPQIAQEVAATIAHHLLTDWLRAEIAREGSRRTGGFESDTAICVDQIVAKFAAGKLSLADIAFSTWLRRIQVELLPFCSGDAIISLDGFARFRLREVVAALRDEIDRVWQDDGRERDFERLVAGLREVLREQVMHDEELHVFTTPDFVWIADADGFSLDDDALEEAMDAALADRDGIDSEDLAIASLIAHSPRRVVLHDLYPRAVWPSFAETVSCLFQERVQRCDGCEVCRQLAHMEQRFRIQWTQNHRRHQR
ncbi:putative sporulation protein YtxC [Alicyclobacillus sacchari]|uniref:Putative sporulation protein YtxC n=1 Tax=Alicyclobacillus sacchari TaxID=392010 RepID=A0A4R8LWQ6_9BACL|nr:putative sporulation protein YtxC [Alicyclobacillus sacchari]GMA56382.1 hypothetical protein GCM10025858_08850 [Alicyclobacillus sacchari]